MQYALPLICWMGVGGMAAFAQVSLASGEFYVSAASDAQGNVYVSRYNATNENYEVVKFINGEGAGTVIYDDLGYQLGAPSDFPWGLAVASNGDVFVAKAFPANDGEIVQLTAPTYGIVTTIQQGRFFTALAVDDDDNLYSMEFDGVDKYQIVQYDATDLSGTGSVVYNGLDLAFDNSYPWGLDVATDGDIYYTGMFGSGDGGLFRLPPPYSTPEPMETGAYNTALFVDAQENIYTSRYNGVDAYEVMKREAGSGNEIIQMSGLESEALFYPWGITVVNNTIFVTDGANGGDVWTVEQNTAPTITCPANITRVVGVAPAAIDFEALASDAEDEVTVSYSHEPGSLFAEGSTTVTATATDAVGNTASCTFDVTVIVDDTPPTISCPEDVDLDCDIDISPEATGSASATDDYDDDVTIDFSDENTDDAIIRTWTATDDFGNFSECTQRLNKDKEQPLITCPADVTLGCDDDTTPGSTGEATAMDNVDPAPIVTFVDTDLGTRILRTWTATDCFGNTTDCVQELQFDTQPPVITCPPNVTLDCNGDDPLFTGEATATDDLDPDVVVTFSDFEDINAITRTWTAIDCAGNSSTCDQILFKDTDAPMITCPPDVTVGCDGTDPSVTGTATASDDIDPNVDVSYSDVTVGATTTRTWRAIDCANNVSECVQTLTLDLMPPTIVCPPDVTIGCDGSDPVVTGSAVAFDNSEGNVEPRYVDLESEGFIRRTWMATDCFGNTSTCEQILTRDLQPPTILCPPNVTIGCDGSDPEVTGSAVAFDNTDDNVTPSFVDEEFDDFIRRTWSVADCHGNSSSCEQILTKDLDAPTIICPADVTIVCDGSTDPAATGEAVANDSVDPNPTVTHSDAVGETSIERTWIATDCAGNESSCIQVITIQPDTDPPTIICPPNVQIICGNSTDPSSTGVAAASDNCDEDVAITSSDEEVANGINRTWQASDDNGNTSTCVQFIEVIPAVTVDAGPDEYVIVDGNGNAPEEERCVDLQAIASGGEGAYSYSWSPSTGLSDVSIANPQACPTETTTYQVTVTDALGCSTTDEITVEAIDLDDPDLPTVGNNKNKIYVCDLENCETRQVNGEANCNSPKSLCYWLRRGAVLGECDCEEGARIANELPMEDASHVVYPNPFDRALQVTLPASFVGHGAIKVSVFGLDGSRLLFREVAPKKDHPLVIDTSEIPTGMYMLLLESDVGILRSKIWKRE